MQNKAPSGVAAALGHIAPIAVLLLCFAIFSGYTVLAKIALLGGTNPLVLAFLRELIATAVLMPARVYTERKKAIEKRRFAPAFEDSGHFMVLGAVMVYGVQLVSALVRLPTASSPASVESPSSTLHPRHSPV